MIVCINVQIVYGLHINMINKTPVIITMIYIHVIRLAYWTWFGATRIIFTKYSVIWINSAWFDNKQ